MTLEKTLATPAHASPPLARGLPLLGNVLDLTGHLPAFFLKNYYKHGPIYRVLVFNQTYTVLAGPEANIFMSRKGNDHLRSYELWHEQNAQYGAQNSLISMDGEPHARLRKVQKRGYSRSAIDGHYPEAVDVVQREVQGWEADRSMPVMEFMQRIVTEQLGTIVANYAPGDYVKDVRVVLRTLLLTTVTKQAPRLLLHLPAYRKARARVWELGHKIIAAHRDGPAEGREPDLIDDLLAAAADESLLPRSDLLIGVLGPYIAGLDTVASTCGFMLYALLKDPDLLQRAQAEADELFANGVPAPEALRHADVLHRAAQETLRIYPIAPATQRTVTAAFEFGGCRVETGERLFIATASPHFMPELYPDPYKFDIDRYLPGRAEHRTPGAYAPFGQGAHTCLGAGFAEVQIMLTMAALLHAADLEMDPPGYNLKTSHIPNPKPEGKFRVRMQKKRAALDPKQPRHWE
jgi:cytochrome P450